VSVLRTLWILSRPQLTVYVLFLIFAGYGWAHWDRALTIQHAPEFFVVLFGWWWLNAGTLWLNAGLDKDEGEVLMGESVAPPPHVERYAYGALLLGPVICFAAHPLAGLACLFCAVLAVLYSHPATVWKGHPVAGPFVNGVGYGLLTPMAGWAVVDVPMDQRTAAVWALGMLGVVGCYFAAQAFQQDEDSERGYRTLVATHGPRTTILTARVCVGLALSGAVVLALAGWIPRATLIIAPLAVWNDRWFAVWMERPGGGIEADAREMARRLLISGLCGLFVALAVYGQESYNNVPVAGLGTVAGHPPDRPLLSPGAMRAWERAQHGIRPAAEVQ